MPAPWAGGAQVRIIGTLHGQTTINVLNFATNTVILDDPTGIGLLKALANAVSECVQTQLLRSVTSEWRFSKCDARRIHPTSGDVVDSDAPQDVLGEKSATSCSFIATLVSIGTGGGGRSGHGRMFLPPTGEAEISQSQIDGPTQLLIAAFLACVAGKFIGALATTEWRLGVLSRKKVNGALPSFDNRFREAISLNSSPVCAELRSRKVGHGV